MRATNGMLASSEVEIGGPTIMNCPILKRGQYGNIGLVGCCAPLRVYKQGCVAFVARYMFPKTVFTHIKACFIIVDDLTLEQHSLDMCRR
jgi:hypothetical protein